MSGTEFDCLVFPLTLQQKSYSYAENYYMVAGMAVRTMAWGGLICDQ